MKLHNNRVSKKEDLEEEDINRKLSKQEKKMHIQQIIQAKKAFEEQMAKTARIQEGQCSCGRPIQNRSKLAITGI